ncbi:hypothetical protein XENOCAPTIV_012964 [Xenoophorus captivus]|uniref:Uncharacterized protein n=1 Tax=Xenoophorus captivus TaxID=1517983 RepID=A0ABV0R9S9_9TELE
MAEGRLLEQGDFLWVCVGVQLSSAIGSHSWSAFQLCERQVAVRSHSPAFWQHHRSATLGPLRAAASGEAPLHFMGTDADGSAALGTLNTWVVSVTGNLVFSPFNQSMCWRKARVYSTTDHSFSRLS